MPRSAEMPRKRGDLADFQSKQVPLDADWQQCETYFDPSLRENSGSATMRNNF
jgi:hypothetical protein